MIQTDRFGTQRVPASWLYVSLGARQTWLRLNGGDRLVVILIALLGLGIAVRFVTGVGSAVAQLAPQWTGSCLGISAFICVALPVSLSLSNVRRGRLFQVLGETRANKHWRIGIEFVSACVLSTLLLGVAAAFLKAQSVPLVVLQGTLVASLAHGLVHLGQLLRAGTSPSRSDPAGLTGLNRRSPLSSVISSFNVAKFKPTSSRFYLKALANPVVWAMLALTLLASGGAAISLKSLLLGLSTLSTLLVIIQLTLAEPRVGNGRTIGASSKNMPIDRALSDFVALAVPHIGLFLLAFGLIALDNSGLALAAAITQLLLTLWIIWMGLLVRALPPLIFTKSTRFLIAGTIIVVQVAPPLFIVVMIIATILSTRDLMQFSALGPAQWPI